MERANRAFLQEAIWGELSWAAGVCLGWLEWFAGGLVWLAEMSLVRRRLDRWLYIIYIRI